jgi:hypothetical protein
MSCLNFPPTELWPLRAAIGRNVAAVRWARGQRYGDAVVLSDGAARRERQQQQQQQSIAGRLLQLPRRCNSVTAANGRKSRP